jgi:xanthine dehydrogenase accessory factor
MFDYLTEAQRLRERDVPFVLATVVRVERPTSAKPGAKAIVTRDSDGDGELRGWIGGSCASPTVVREALKALADGQPRLLHLSPTEMLRGIPSEGLVEVPLTCASGGTLEIYLEPHLPQPHVLTIGHLPVVEALVNFAKDLGYRASVMGQGVWREEYPRADSVLELDLDALPINKNTYVVVASHGNYDETALEVALRSEAAYVAIVASKKRAASVLAYLRESGLTEAQLGKLKFPAGLDIGAATPEEIGLSIVAEMVQLRRRGQWVSGTVDSEQASSVSHEAICPTCGMTVDKAKALHTHEYNGVMYYFCCPNCKRHFVKDPEKMLATRS